MINHMMLVTCHVLLILPVISLVVISLTAHEESVFRILRDIISAKKLSQGIVFVCWDYGYPDFVITLWSAGLQVAVLKPALVNRSVLHTLPNMWYRTFIVIDMSCQGSDVTVKALSSRFGSASYHWFLLWNVQSLLSSDIYWRRDGEVLLVEPVDTATFHLYDVFSDMDRSPVVSSYDKWISGDKMLSSVAYKFSACRRGDFQSQPLRAVGVRMDTGYNFVSLYEKTGFGPHDQNVEIFLTLQRMFNFSINLHILHNATSGEKEIVQQLAANTADIAPIIQGVITEKANYIDFIQPISKLAPVIVFKQPATSSLQNIFLLPFSTSTWLCLVFTAMLTIALLQISLYSTEKQASHHEEPWNLSETALLILGFACQQSSSRLPHALSSRIMIIGFVFPFILLYTTYSGQVVSRLSTPDTLISSIEDLVQYKYVLHTDDYPYLQAYFKQSQDESLRRLAQNMKKLNSKYAMAEVLKGFQCYSSADVLIYPLTMTVPEEQRCKLGIFKLPHAEISLAMAIPKNSPFQEMFNWGSIKLHERGIITRGNDQATDDRKQIQCSEESFETVDLNHLSSAFLILGLGVFASAVTYLAELVIHNRIHRSKMQYQREQHGNQIKRHHFSLLMQTFPGKMNSKWYP